MRKFTLNSMSFFAALGLALSFGLVACDGGDDGSDTVADSTSGDGDGDPTTTGDGDPTTGDGDPTTTGDGDCIPPPEECTRFVSCIGAIAPDQLGPVSDQYGEGGTCWCSGVDAANSCFTTCLEQLDIAIKNNPTEQACHENSCTLDELDPTQAYGPVVGGACPDYLGNPQLPAMLGGVPGSFCSPPCTGLADACPQHTQTSAPGECGLNLGGELHCLNHCYVDPTLLGGTQCQCGATCQPNGGPDGNGNLRGICTFE